MSKLLNATYPDLNSVVTTSIYHKFVIERFMKKWKDNKCLSEAKNLHNPRERNEKKKCKGN